MDLIASYSSSDEEEKMPSIPDSILNRYSKKPKLKNPTTSSNRLTSFVYYNWKLSKDDIRRVESSLSAVDNYKPLIHNDLFKTINDLHISLSYNFEIELDKLDDLISDIKNIFTKTIHLKFLDNLELLHSSTTDKKFVVLKLETNIELQKFIEDLNELIKNYDPNYQYYDPMMIHCSIAELQPNGKINSASSTGLTKTIDRLSITRGRQVVLISI